MSATRQQHWTQEAFLDWSEGQEGRFEFDGFAPVAMTGGSPLHAVLVSQLAFALQRRLEGGPCRALVPDAGLATVGGAIRYPDAMITCAPLDLSRRTFEGVVVVFEVLSPSSGRTDRIVKVREYAGVASIRRYVIIESSGMGMTVLSRSGPDEIWTAVTLAEGETLVLPEVGIELPVAEVYGGVAFAAEA